MPIARDETLAPPRWPDATRNRAGYKPPEVLFDDKFDGSFCGWRDHSGGSGANASAYSPVSLTTLRTHSESRAALMLSTSGRGTTAAPRTGTTSTYKNLSRDVDQGLIKFEAWVALGGSDLANAPLSWSLTIDCQTWDGASRGFPRLDAVRFTGSGFNARSNAWAIKGDAGENHYIGKDGTDKGNAVPALGASPPMAGDNESKLNIQYVALTYDLSGVYPSATNTDGKPGGYYEVQVGPQVVDVSGWGAGRHLTAPQVDAAGGPNSFNGGFNCGFQLNDTPQAAAGGSWLIVTRARALWYPEAS